MASIISAVSDLVHGAIEFVLSIFRHAFNIVASVVQGILNAIQHVIGAVLNLAGDFVGIITSNLVPILIVVGAIFAFNAYQRSQGTAVGKKRA